MTIRIPFGLRRWVACTAMYGAALLWSGALATAGEAAPKPAVPAAPLVLPVEGGKPTESKTDPALPAIDWDAIDQSIVDDKDALVLSGSAWIRYLGNKLEADQIVIFRKTRELYAEGNVRLRVGESEVSASVAYVDINTDTGYMVDAVVRISAPPTALTDLQGRKEDPRDSREELRQLDSDQYAPAYLRGRDPYGIYLESINDPQARTNLVFKANKVVKNGRLQFTAEDVVLTPDDMVHPMYAVKAGKIDFFMKEEPSVDKLGQMDLKPARVIAQRARINIAGVSLFPFPTIKYDLDRKNPFFQITGGNSSRWGPYVLTRFGFNLGNDGRSKIFNPTHLYLDLDERVDRGPAGGVDFNWQTGRRPNERDPDKSRFEQGLGYLRFYVTEEIQMSRRDDIQRARRELERRIQPKIDGFPRREYDANILFTKRRKLADAGPPSFELNEHRDDFRGYVDFYHHQPLKRFAGLDNLQLDFKYERHSDRDFMAEYFTKNYYTENQPEGLVSVRKPGDNYSVELLYRANTQDFDSAPARSAYNHGTFTGYEPALTYSLTHTPLPYGFYLKSELQAARLTREFEREIYDQSDYTANRLYGQFEFSRPVKWKGVNFVPRLGTQQQAYDNTRSGDEALQGAVTYGFDVTSRIYGTFNDFENDALGLRGMRHIIEPRMVYSGVSDPQERPEDLLDFDEVDDLQAYDKVTFAIDQTFQTKRPTKDGSMRSVNFAGFDMSIDYFPRDRDKNRLLNGDSFGNLKLDGYLRVVDVLKLDASAGFSIEDGQLETAAYGVTIDPRTRWKLRFEERFNFDDENRAIVGSDQFRVKFEVKVSDRWTLFAEAINERKKALLQRKGRQLSRIGVIRSYGPLDVTFSYSVDTNTRESGFFASVRPTPTYRNVTVPQQDLLVAEGEVAGDAEAPEETNFDPFELLKRRRTRQSPTGTKPLVPPPPPGPQKDLDVPVPPPPGGASNSGAKAPGDAALFSDPNASPAKRKPRPVDEDEWTAPPATPASTR